MPTSSGGSASSDMEDADHGHAEAIQSAADISQHESVRKVSWAAVLGKSLISVSKKNVLEVVLQKDSKGSFTVSDIECAKFLTKIGIDMRSGADIEGVQICPNGRGAIFITLKENVNIDRFCRYDIIEVSSSGIRSILIKPAGMRDVTVNVKGLHPNTSDSIVIEYLEKFGKLVSNKVIHSTYTDGPLKGLKNGDRCYRMEVKPDVYLGSYHILDGQKIFLRYPGQVQTCAHCLKSAIECKGRGVARRCVVEGGLRTDFAKYICDMDMWEEMGYLPERRETDENFEVNQQLGGEYTPMKCISSPEKFSGVLVKRFPRDMDHGEIMELLTFAGLPDESKNDVEINNRGAVTIRNLENNLCQELIRKLHGKMCYSRKLNCNGLIPITPTKEVITDLLSEPRNTTEEHTPTGPSLNSSATVVEESSPPILNTVIPTLLSPLNSSVSWPQFEEEDLVRRHSIPLIDRTPPSNSLAADLLGTSRLISNSLVASIRKAEEVLSEFNPSLSSISSGECETEGKSGSPLNTNLKKRKKITPEKHQNPTKSNRKHSPDKVEKNGVVETNKDHND